MKAILVGFTKTFNTGDECKGSRPRQFTCQGILFEDEEEGGRKVLFLKGGYREKGRFFRVVGINGEGTLTFEGRFDGQFQGYDVPEDAMERIKELPFTESEVSVALAMPDMQKLVESMSKECAGNVSNPKQQ